MGRSRETTIWSFERFSNQKIANDTLEALRGNRPITVTEIGQLYVICVELQFEGAGGGFSQSSFWRTSARGVVPACSAAAISNAVIARAIKKLADLRPVKMARQRDDRLNKWACVGVCRGVPSQR